MSDTEPVLRPTNVPDPACPLHRSRRDQYVAELTAAAIYRANVDETYPSRVKKADARIARIKTERVHLEAPCYRCWKEKT